MNVKKGDLVRMEYTGKIAATGQVFDTTDESVAKKAGIFEPSAVYGPKIAIFGSSTIIAGIEEAIAISQAGKSQDFLISAGKAFGEKQKSLIRMMPEREFAKQGVRPVPGLVITLDGLPAMVKSITSGRVVVDFNHPLAGEKVIYRLTVHEVIADDRKKIEALLSSFGMNGKISQSGKAFTVALDKGKGESKEKLEHAKSVISAVVPGTAFA